MVSDFLGAAFPWILIGLFVAISCSLNCTPCQGHF